MRNGIDLADSQDIPIACTKLWLALHRVQSPHLFPNIWGYILPDSYVLALVSSNDFNKGRRCF